MYFKLSFKAYYLKYNLFNQNRISIAVVFHGFDFLFIQYFYILIDQDVLSKCKPI